MAQDQAWRGWVCSLLLALGVITKHVHDCVFLNIHTEFCTCCSSTSFLTKVFDLYLVQVLTCLLSLSISPYLCHRKHLLYPLSVFALLVLFKLSFMKIIFTYWCQLLSSSHNCVTVVTNHGGDAHYMFWITLLFMQSLKKKMWTSW